MNLQDCAEIKLIRCQNGWVACDGNYIEPRRPFFAFESTESLARQLTTLIGHSGWKIEGKPRDNKGQFTKQP